eukprot:TRINITY_DN9162_c1_g1_i3.p3 TRINITY_DN9162_c1_g1~~TRINITY_DN9162_c1_g1_i3.p3  ORF type:complete len:263 (-),score=-10.73 TRINITY_DN9162_c1_g1_i3:132-920(-)
MFYCIFNFFMHSHLRTFMHAYICQKYKKIYNIHNCTLYLESYITQIQFQERERELKVLHLHCDYLLQVQQAMIQVVVRFRIQKLSNDHHAQVIYHAFLLKYIWYLYYVIFIVPLVLFFTHVLCIVCHQQFLLLCFSFFYQGLQQQKSFNSVLYKQADPGHEGRVREPFGGTGEPDFLLRKRKLCQITYKQHLFRVLLALHSFWGQLALLILGFLGFRMTESISSTKQIYKCMKQHQWVGEFPSPQIYPSHLTRVYQFYIQQA